MPTHTRVHQGKFRLHDLAIIGEVRRRGKVRMTLGNRCTGHCFDERVGGLMSIIGIP